MTREEEIIRAERAKQILGDSLVGQALKEIKEGLIEEWRRASVKDAEMREKIWAIYVGACKFEELLKSHIETGKLARAQLETESQQRSFMERQLARFMS